MREASSPTCVPVSRSSPREEDAPRGSKRNLSGRGGTFTREDLEFTRGEGGGVISTGRYFHGEREREREREGERGRERERERYCNIFAYN